MTGESDVAEVRNAPAESDAPVDPVQVPPPGSPKQGVGSRVLWFCVVVALWAVLIRPLAQLTPVASLPFIRASIATQLDSFQYDNEEGALLFQTLEMKHGNSIYHRLTGYPYVVGTYPPLYMALNAPFVDPESPSFKSGRVLVTGAVVGIAVLLAAIVALRSRQVLAAALAALVFLATFEVHNWIAYYRVDLPALFFSVMGIGCIAVSPRRDKTAAVASILLFTLSFFTKQTMIAGPLAAICWYFMGGWRVGLRYITGLVVAIGIPYAALCAATRGQFFVHTVLYNMNSWTTADLLVWVRHAARFYPYLLMCAVTAVIGLAATHLTTGRDAADQKSAAGGSASPTAVSAAPVVLYAFFSLLGFLAVGKAGSAENYLLEPLAAVTLLVCDTLGRMIRATASGGRPILPAVTASALALLLLVHAERISVGTLPQKGGSVRIKDIMFDVNRNPSLADLRVAADVATRVRHADGDTLTELGIFNIANGQPVFFQPFIMSELARQKRWDPTAFEADLKAGRFVLVVTNFDINSKGYTDVYTSETLRILRDNYVEEERMTDGRLWKYYLYRPRNSEATDGNLVMARRKPACARMG